MAISMRRTVTVTFNRDDGAVVTREIKTFCSNERILKRLKRQVNRNFLPRITSRGLEYRDEKLRKVIITVE